MFNLFHTYYNSGSSLSCYDYMNEEFVTMKCNKRWTDTLLKKLPSSSLCLDFSSAAKGLYLEVGYIQSFVVVSGTLGCTDSEIA